MTTAWPGRAGAPHGREATPAQRRATNKHTPAMDADPQVPDLADVL